MYKMYIYITCQAHTCLKNILRLPLAMIPQDHLFLLNQK